jgi:hypothetical protein
VSKPGAAAFVSGSRSDGFFKCFNVIGMDADGASGHAECGEPARCDQAADCLVGDARVHTERMSCEVRLSTLEFCDAVDVAAARIRASAHRNLNHAKVRSRSMLTRLSDDIAGAAAELAVAKWLGIPWSRSVNTYLRWAGWPVHHRAVRP